MVDIAQANGQFLVGLFIQEWPGAIADTVGMGQRVVKQGWDRTVLVAAAHFLRNTAAIRAHALAHSGSRQALVLI